MPLLVMDKVTVLAELEKTLRWTRLLCATDVTEAVAADVAEASHESEIPPQTDV
jgi:hypothetical protein